MRIIGGKVKGLHLAPVGSGDAAAHLRPTTDRVRENIFNVLSGGRFGDPLRGARVLDLFAGTGALGLEAFSRGADHVAFVDTGAVAKTLLKKNIALCRAERHVTTLAQNATKLARCIGAPYNLLFLDPPYGQSLGISALASARLGGWLAPDALIVWEENSQMSAAEGLVHRDSRRYGQSWINIFTFPAPLSAA